MNEQTELEIMAVLRKHGVSLAEWNRNLYIVTPGFQVYSVRCFFPVVPN